MMLTIDLKAASLKEQVVNSTPEVDDDETEETTSINNGNLSNKFEIQ